MTAETNEPSLLLDIVPSRICVSGPPAALSVAMSLPSWLMNAVQVEVDQMQEG